MIEHASYMGMLLICGVSFSTEADKWLMSVLRAPQLQLQEGFSWS
jgi:hypothetical protein